VQTFEGLLALNTGRLREAVERLKDLPLERDHSLVNDALFTRAEAYRRARHFVEAERDYRALLARKHPYPFSMLVPFGTLGLAGTLAASGNAAAALAEYQKVLDVWKDADPDLAIVREVRAEVAKLGT
jgi:tetratricopeptide (TPR) repeat protein